MSKIAMARALADSAAAPQVQVIRDLSQVPAALTRLLEQIEETQGEVLTRLETAQASSLAKIEEAQGQALAQIAPLAAILERSAADQAEKEAAQSRRIEQFATALAKLLKATTVIEEGMRRFQTAQESALAKIEQSQAQGLARMESAQEKGVERMAGQIEPLALALATLAEETRAALAEARAEAQRQTQDLLHQQQENASTWQQWQTRQSETWTSTLAGWKSVAGELNGAARMTREAADRTSRDLWKVAGISSGAAAFLTGALLIGFLAWQPPTPKVTLEMNGAAVAEQIIPYLPKAQPPAQAPAVEPQPKETAPKRR